MKKRKAKSTRLAGGEAMKITHVITDGNVGGAGLLAVAIAEALADEFETEIILPHSSRLTQRINTDRFRYRNSSFCNGRD